MIESSYNKVVAYIFDEKYFIDCQKWCFSKGYYYYTNNKVCVKNSAGNVIFIHDDNTMTLDNKELNFISFKFPTLKIVKFDKNLQRQEKLERILK